MEFCRVGVHFGNYRFANDCGEGYQSSCNRYVQDFEIERIIPHPDFDRKVYLVHDIGLVRLNGMVTYSGIYDHSIGRNYDVNVSFLF